MIGFLGVLGIVFLMLTYSAFSWGYVASVFYGWFILPNFPTLPHFTVAQFVGFMIFANVTINRTSPGFIKDDYKDKLSEWLYFFISPWLTLFFGWLIYNTWFI